MPRIFVSVPVAAPVRSAMSGLRRHHVSSLRWVAEHQYHITLKFLGEIPEPHVQLVRSAVEQAAAAVGDGRIRLSARGVGAFPDVRRARIVWVGVSGEADRLRTVQRAVEERLTAAGFAPDGRRFTPHITVARARQPVSLPPELVTYESHVFGAWEVDGIDIIESRLTPTGPHYTVRHHVPLG